MNEFIFKGSDLRIKTILEGWATYFGLPFNGKKLSYAGEHGKFKAVAFYMPSGLDFVLVDLGLIKEYFVEISPHEKEAYILWVDVPHSQSSIEKISSPDFHLVPKLVFLNNKMNFKLPRIAPANGYTFLIYIHPQLLSGLLTGPNWKSIFTWYFSLYVTNLDFLKINAVELNIANSLHEEINGNASLIKIEKYLYQLLELFFLKLEKKYNAINKRNSLLEIETIYVKKLNQLMQEQFVNGNVSKEIILEEIGLSKYQLDKLLKKVYDLRFGEYHTNEKLAYAVELLKSNRMDVQEIAIHIGYADSSSFIEAFKNKYNKTPLEVKKNARQLRYT